MSSPIDVVVDPRALTGEGPLWDPERKLLCWVDIPGKRYHEFDPATGDDRVVEVDRYVGAIAFRQQGGMVAAVHDGIAEFDPTSGAIKTFVSIEADREGNRMNDAQVDPAGRFFAGTMGLRGQKDTGTLYHVDPDHTVTTVITPVSISNGMGWSPDQRTMYYIDSLARRIDILDYDIDTGTIGRRDVIPAKTRPGAVPDGMTVDAEGYLWVAFHGGWCVQRYSPAGQLDMEIELPVSGVTSCTFGGDDLGDLYITSSTMALDEAAPRVNRSPAACSAAGPGPPGG